MRWLRRRPKRTPIFGRITTSEGKRSHRHQYELVYRCACGAEEVGV